MSTQQLPMGDAAGRTGRFVIDSGSTVTLRIRRLGFWVEGGFAGLSGVIDLARGSTGGRVVARVPVAGFHSSHPRWDREVVGPAVLDAAHYPDLRYDSVALHPTGPDRCVCDGLLTVRDVTQPVTFDVQHVQWSAGGARLNATAAALLRRSAFGVTASRWLFGDEVAVTIAARAIRYASGAL